MPSAGCVLIVDDDPSIREMLTEYLGAHGYVTAQAADGTEMRAAIERAAPDVVLLDLRLPREDGLTLARFLRERYDVGIIMVTGASEIVDRIVGLEVGADDYVTKPFDPRELLARVKSVLRRTQARPTGDAAGGAAERGDGGAARRVPFGHCRLDLASHQLFDAEGAEIPITTMEFDLLKVFVENPGKALSRDRILTLTHDREWDPYDRSIDIRIARLRRKLEADPEHPQLIRTVRGVGYMYAPPPG
jgi:two-component system phosphate regulon response regulator OmpR